MKNRSLVALFVCLFFAQSLYSQSLEVGMEIKYLSEDATWWPARPITYDTTTLRVTSDTLISSERAFRIDHITECNAKHITYIGQDSLKMYYYLEGEKELLYDFSLEPGDTMIIRSHFEDHTFFSPEDSFIYVTIVSTEKKSLGGREFIIQNVSASADIWAITQGVGGDRSFFPRHGLCETFTCLYSVKYPGEEPIIIDRCRLSNTTKLNTEKKLNIYPNPAENVLYVNVLKPSKYPLKFTLFDSQGRVIYNKTLLNNQNLHVLNLGTLNLAHGIYYYSIKENEFEIVNSSIIINKNN